MIPEPDLTLQLRVRYHDGGEELVIDASEHPSTKVWKIGHPPRKPGAPTPDIPIRNGYVSGRHAELRFDEEEYSWMIRDCNSRNGTWINGQRLDSMRWTVLNTINHEERAYFSVVPKAPAWLGFTSLISDTYQQREAEPNTVGSNQPLDYRTGKPLKQEDLSTGQTLADVALVFLDPPGIPKLIWWPFLALLAAAVIVLIWQ